MSPFADPAPAGSLPLEGRVGHYVLVKPVAYRDQVQTTFGAKDAIEVNVVDLSTAEHENGVLWFAGKVIGSLKGQIGQLVLAQVTQGVAKAGQSAPWELVGASQIPEVVAAAEGWLAANPGALDGITSPAAPAAPSAAPAGVVAAPVAAPPAAGLAPGLAAPPVPPAAPQLA
jgi:hypothetical protein